MRRRGLGIVDRTRPVLSLIVASLAALLGPTVFATPVAACGGFFCTTVPVDQAAERVIFTMDEGTVTTYVQINYVGAAEDFAWILPVPAVPQIDTADMATFRDLNRLTSPVYLGPRPPDCLRRPMPASAPRSASESTTVHASGEVGPFGYHVVSSPNHQDLVQWLRANGYRITPEMEPLIKMYTDDGLIFLAMKLRQGQNSRDVVPVKLTYEATLPMIPLRLTAVAATPDMPVIVWVFAREKVAPLNFAPIRIADSEVAFNPMGGHDYYTRVVPRAVDQAGGRAFITEFAGPTTALRPPTDETAKLLFQQYPYLTRLYTQISPEEMTLDPVFDLSPGQADVSNVHDLSSYPPPWNCSDDFNTFKTVAGSGPPPAGMAGQRYLQGFTQGGAPKGLMLFGLVALSAVILARRRLDLVGRWELTPQATALLFLETVLLQGFHELEHVVQVTQRSVLGISKGAGMLGSVFDVEPVHMAYNAAFLLLLGAVFLGVRRNPMPLQARTTRVTRLVAAALAFQAYHTLEHVVKMWQYFETGLNGTPGIVGHWIPVIYLHLGYNTLVYVPVLLAFILGGYHHVAFETLRRSLPRHHPTRLHPAS